MANPQVFNAVRDSCTILGRFFTEVSQEVGEKRAAEMYGKYAEGFGEAIGNLIKENKGQEAATEKIAAGLDVMFAGFGIDGKFDITPATIECHTTACPIYDGFLAAGLEHQTIETMCRSAGKCEATALERIVPDAEISLVKFKEKADDFCTEVIKLS